MKTAQHYKEALEQIRDLENATEIRGLFLDIGVPEHLVKEGGRVPMHPYVKDGLMFAVKIAKDALEEKP